MGRREVPNCLDAALNQAVAHLLGVLNRHCNNTHVNIVILAKLFHLIHGKNGFFADRWLRRNIKCCQNIQSVCLKAGVAQKRLAQLACAY